MKDVMLLIIVADLHICSESDCAAKRFYESVDDLKYRGFSCAVVTDYRDMFTSAYPND